MYSLKNASNDTQLLVIIKQKHYFPVYSQFLSQLHALHTQVASKFFPSY